MNVYYLIKNYKAQQVLPWLLFLFFIRYVYFADFTYTPSTFWWRSLQFTVDTALLYYLFSLYIFPIFLYRKKYALFLVWVFLSHVLTYLINYFSLDVLNIFFAKEQDLPEWTVYRRGGIFGFIVDGNAAVTSILWSYQLVIILIEIRAFRDILQLRTQYYRSEQDRLRLEVDFLKTQVNPHFLFNTLNSVYARIFEIGLDKELAYIQNYLDLERNRLSGQDVLIDYEQSGEPAHCQIAPLLLIAFVENAFKHGVKGATQPAYVQVRAEVNTAGQFIFIVENSLPSRQPVTLSEGRSGGVGLGNVRRRLEALYAGQYTLTTQADIETYTTTLIVHLEVVRLLTQPVSLT